MADAAGKKKNAAARSQGGQRSDMTEADLQAFKPILFQEIGPGVKFNANFCRNPMCPNFGPAPNLDAYRERYKVEAYSNFLVDRHYTCRICNMRSRLLSNRSLRAAYVWFKRQSIPFAACRNEACGQHGINVFEHSGHYESKGHDSAKCRACEGRCSLGEPLGRTLTNKVRRRLTKIYEQMTRTGRQTLTVVEEFKDPHFDVRRYMDASAALARRLRDYQSYCNAELVAPGYPERLGELFAGGHDGLEVEGHSPFDGVATLVTDTMFISLQVPRRAYPRREHRCPVTVTALTIAAPGKINKRQRRVFLLAAHPHLVLRAEDLAPEDPAVAIADATLPVADRRFDHIDHYGTDHSENVWLKRKAQSYVGSVRGLYMRPDYAALAHFMVLKDLTGRFDRVTLCMDGDSTSYKSAAAVFAEDIRTRVEGKQVDGDKGSDIRRAEIAVLQTENAQNAQNAQKSSGKGRTWASEKKRVARDWETKLRSAKKGKGGDAGAKARLFRSVLRGGWSDAGSWGWLDRGEWKEKRQRVTWLSQGPDRDWPPDDEVETFLKWMSLYFVDSAIAALRRRAFPLERPTYRAEGGANYVHASQNVGFVTSGLWLSWFNYNYDNAKDAKDGKPQKPAVLDLMRQEDRRGFKVERHLDFRLGWRHAVELTKRLGNAG